MNLFNCLAIFYACRLQNLKERRLPSRRVPHSGLETAAPCERFLDRWWFDALLTPGWFVRLRDDPNHVMFRLEQRFQCRYADLTSANKNNPHTSKSHVINGREGPPGRPFLRRALATASDLWSRLTKSGFLESIEAESKPAPAGFARSLPAPSVSLRK